MVKEKTQEYTITPHLLGHMSDTDVDQILLRLLPISLPELYETCGIGRSHAKKTKKRIRKRLNALIDKELAYLKGSGFHNTVYHRKKKYKENV